MAFSVRHFFRQVPVKTLKQYLESKNAGVPAGWWLHHPNKLAKELTDFLATTDRIGETVLAELTRVHPMASDRGRTALINASAHDPDVLTMFGDLENDHETGAVDAPTSS